uniref:Uncharacterized protein n=1 Tax=Trichuris muris TaxID=70415 RepID=A0A5S6QC76_TRIMR
MERRLPRGSKAANRIPCSEPWPPIGRPSRQPSGQGDSALENANIFACQFNGCSPPWEDEAPKRDNLRRLSGDGLGRPLGTDGSGRVSGRAAAAIPRGAVQRAPFKMFDPPLRVPDGCPTDLLQLCREGGELKPADRQSWAPGTAIGRFAHSFVPAEVT